MKPSIKYAAITLGLCLLGDFIYLGTLQPNWNELAVGKISGTAFIEQYQRSRSIDPKLPKVRWEPVLTYKFPENITRAFVIAEDARFFLHTGVDWNAVREAIDYNLETEGSLVGASTISQQVTKNLVLSPSRNPLRKWHEYLLTWRMEAKLSKEQILNIYLNIIEFGEGVYGIEAASRFYFNKSAQQLLLHEAIELAAALPSPKKHNPKTRSNIFLHRVKKIQRWLSPEAESPPSEVGTPEPAPPPQNMDPGLQAEGIDLGKSGESPINDSESDQNLEETLPEE